MIGRIIKSLAGFYYVETEKGVIETRARGNFRNQKLSPKVGDKVEISLNGKTGAVEKIYPRKNELSRPPVSNIDNLYIVVSTTSPEPRLSVIDEIIVLAERANITPIIVISKTDLVKIPELCETYKKAGFEVFDANDDYEKIKASMVGKLSAFTGNSGVGKSTLLNRINPELKLETGEISEKLGRGRHTTRTVEILKTEDGAFAIDTPGFSINPDDIPPIFKDEMQDFFREFNPYKDSCLFRGCSHRTEKGCAVLKALGEGKIAPSRHQSYLYLYSKVENLKKWEMKRN